MKTLRAFVAGVGVFVVLATSAGAERFNDTFFGDVYFDAIQWLYGVGVVQGYPDGSFGYTKPINRAELLKIVYETAYLPVHEEPILSYSGALCFKDLQKDNWANKYICWAAANGMVQGYSDGTFRPHQDITFVEAQKIVLQVFGHTYDMGTTPWYKGVVDTAADHIGIPLTIKTFDQKITRSEMADMVVRRFMYTWDPLDRSLLKSYLDERFDWIVNYDNISSGWGAVQDIPECDGYGCKGSEVVIEEKFGKWDVSASGNDQGRIKGVWDAEGEYTSLPDFEWYMFNSPAVSLNGGPVAGYFSVTTFAPLVSEGIYLYFPYEMVPAAGDKVVRGIVRYSLDTTVEEELFVAVGSYLNGTLHPLTIIGMDTTNDLLLFGVERESEASCQNFWLDNPIYSIAVWDSARSDSADYGFYRLPSWKWAQELKGC